MITFCLILVGGIFTGYIWHWFQMYTAYQILIYFFFFLFFTESFLNNKRNKGAIHTKLYYSIENVFGLFYFFCAKYYNILYIIMNYIFRYIKRTQLNLIKNNLFTPIHSNRYFRFNVFYETFYCQFIQLYLKSILNHYRIYTV